MKTIAGVLSLLVVLAIVGVFAAVDLHQITIAAGGSSAVISAPATGVTPQQQIQSRGQASGEVAVQQVQPDADDQ